MYNKVIIRVHITFFADMYAKGGGGKTLVRLECNFFGRLPLDC